VLIVKGEILIDGVALDELDIARWRAQIGYENDISFVHSNLLI
jgi:ABC-type bacteriocin/lantibiotic exporter with double-glycine peptidase domain